MMSNTNRNRLVSILRGWEDEDGNPLDLETARCLGGNWTPDEIEEVWDELYSEL